MTQALQGIRVLDLSQSIAGQFCGRMLADYGAEVTLVEPPGGSALRRQGPFRDAEARHSLLFFHNNTGKTSVTLDISTLSGRERLTALARGADVVIVEPGMDPVVLRAANPDCVLATISGFGTDGPYRQWQGTEMIYQALAGIMRRNGEAGREPLHGCGDRASYGAGVAAYIAILAALHARPWIQGGQDVAVDIAETTAAMANPFVTQYLYNGIEEPRGRPMPFARLACRDGWVGIYLHVHLWPALCEAVGLPDLVRDPRFAPAKARLENWAELEDILQRQVGEWSAGDLLARVQSKKIVAAQAYSLVELRRNNPHLDARDYWETVDTPDGSQTILGPQFRMGATPRQVHGAAPDLGSASAPVRGGASGAGRDRGAAPGRTAGGPLAGLRVVELTTAWAGPMAGRILGFLGAEVIHVETGSRLDSWRQHGQVFSPGRYPRDGAGARPWNRVALFNSQNENKLSLTLDVKKPGGLDAMLRLLAKTDVLLCNFTAGTLDRMGIGYRAARAVRPDIIVVEMPAFGGTGPMSHATAIGPTMEMAAGMAGMIGYPGGPPSVTGPTYPDPIGAFHGAAAVLTALAHRRRTGQGQHVEVPQVEAAMHYIGEHILHAIETGTAPKPRGNHVDHAAPHDAYPAAGDDEWVAIAVTTEKAFDALCRVIGEPALADDPRFSTLPQRRRHQDELRAPISAWTRMRDKHAAAAALQGAGVTAAPVNGGGDGAESAYLAARGWFTVLDHPDIGPVAHEGLPFHLSRTPGGQHRAAPCLGQDTQAILRDIVGLSEAEIDAMARAGTISAEPARSDIA